MSLAPMMSPHDAGTALPAHLFPGVSFAPADSHCSDRPADLGDLPPGGLNRAEHTGSSSDMSTEVPFDLTHETNRDLRRWSNALYKVLDADFPPYGAIDDYERIVAEIERREARNAQESPSAMREKFRDNAVGCRFELFRNGLLAGYVSYTMRAGALRLHRTMITADFDGTGLEDILMRNVILTAHKRRLTTIPYCPVAQSFLQENPQYQRLIHA
jgi:predicted GNAT family acetyltransferase